MGSEIGASSIATSSPAATSTSTSTVSSTGASSLAGRVPVSSESTAAPYRSGPGYGRRAGGEHRATRPRWSR